MYPEGSSVCVVTGGEPANSQKSLHTAMVVRSSVTREEWNAIPVALVCARKKAASKQQARQCRARD